MEISSLGAKSKPAIKVGDRVYVRGNLDLDPQEKTEIMAKGIAPRRHWSAALMVLLCLAGVHATAGGAIAAAAGSLLEVSRSQKDGRYQHIAVDRAGRATGAAGMP